MWSGDKSGVVGSTVEWGMAAGQEREGLSRGLTGLCSSARTRRGALSRGCPLTTTSYHQPCHQPRLPLPPGHPISPHSTWTTSPPSQTTTLSLKAWSTVHQLSTLPLLLQQLQQSTLLTPSSQLNSLVTCSTKQNNFNPCTMPSTLTSPSTISSCMK